MFAKTLNPKGKQGSEELGDFQVGGRVVRSQKRLSPYKLSLVLDGKVTPDQWVGNAF